MGTLNIYKGLSEEYRTIKGNASVNELAHELYPELDLEQCIILNAGEQIAPDYILKDNDIVFIRVIPGATGAVVMAVISLVCAAVAVGAAVYSAVEQQKAQEEMEKAQKQAKALAERITQLPFLKGANNRSALGYNIPYIMGSVYDVPYKLVAGYYTISGENGANQFWNVLLVAGFNNALIQDVSIGTKVIKKPNGTIEIPGQVEEFSYMEDSGENPYYFENDCPFYDPADKLDVKYENEVVIAGLNEKVSCTSFSDELDYNNAVVKQAATNTYKFDVCILFNGLRRYDDGWKSKNVSLKVEWSNDGSTWNDAGNIVTGDINSRKQVRFSKTVTLTAAQCVGKDIQIRLTRLTALEESNSQETCYLCYLNCWQYDAAKSTDNNIVTCAPLEQPWRGRTTRIALRIISNESTKDNLDQININAYGKARIWNNDAWTVNRYPTRNPASWVLEVMTTDVHPHSRYNDDEIDLEALGAVYTYCEQNGFYCDGILTEDSKKADILNSILSECNTTMYRDDATGKWTFAIEKAQSTPVALLNEQCIKSVTVTKTFERKPYAVKTTFTNRESWAVDTFYQTVNGKVDSSAVYGEHKIIVENAPKYITTFEHAYKYTHRILAKQQLQPREITVQVGRDGDYYPLYSKIMLQMKQLRIGLSNGIIHGVVVEGGLLKQIITSDFCDFSDSNARYGLIIQAQNDNAKEHLYIEVTAGTLTQYAIGALGVGMIGSGNNAIGFYAPGKTRVLNLRTPLAVNVLPEYGNIYSFGYLNASGEFSRVTNEMMIYNRKQNSDGWELLLKDYNSVIFQFGDIPEYQTNLTTPKESGYVLPETIMQKMADIADEVRIPGPQGPQGNTGPQGPQGEPGESVYNVRFDVESFCFTCDNTGKAWGEKVAATIHLTYGEEELPFTIVSIGNDGSQIAATIKGKTIYFESLKGVKIDEGGNIPVVIRYRATTGTAIGFNNYAIGYSNKPIGYLNYAGENKDFTVYFNFSTVRAGANKGLLTEINDYLSAGGTRYKGDYFTWGGATASVTYGGVTYTFLKGRVYSWNGYQWAESTDDGEISDSFNNVMSVLDDEIVSNNSKLEQTMRKLSAVTVFCEELATKVAFISKLFTQKITMQQGGLFKSANWNGVYNQDTGKIDTNNPGSAGWAIDYFGNSVLNNGIFRGKLEAASGTFNGDLVGGKVYFSSLGLYGLRAGHTDNDVGTSDRTEDRLKYRLSFDVAQSTLTLLMSITGAAGGDTGNRPLINLGIYYKKNGSVSTSNYDGRDTYSGRPGTSGTSYTLSHEWDFSIANPGEYIEIMFTYDTDYIPIPASCTSMIGISEKNKYLKSCVDITEL
ncbi:MAG: collagen-like protein [Treponema sp.]|nr:collagen-like protein [Treponema sp.]